MIDTAESPLIVCFGDSLTVGYQSPTPDSPMLRETPYGARLKERLGAGVRVMIRGICGEVTGEMALRFRQDVLNHRPYAVVILGGTNDLGWNADPADIMRNLLKMYEQSLGAGVRPVAVTVPSIRLEGETEESGSFLADHLMRRRSLNDLITDYCRRKGIPCVDLFTATAEPETLCLAARYSNDGLHLTTDGYARLADLLYEQVFAAWLPSLERSHERSQ
ncbi:MAG TPA: GDSL-type esterase/lipase family protein [Nitrospiraceae bacterium]|nr:GDSL-type esterase/lipase family protein [Nitrospiraceae bacterium]